MLALLHLVRLAEGGRILGAAKKGAKRRWGCAHKSLSYLRTNLKFSFRSSFLCLNSMPQVPYWAQTRTY